MSGTQYDDPNRESIGLEPIWSGAGDAEPPPINEIDPPPESRKAKAAKDEPEPDAEPKAKK